MLSSLLSPLSSLFISLVPPPLSSRLISYAIVSPFSSLISSHLSRVSSSPASSHLSSLDSADILSLILSPSPTKVRGRDAADDRTGIGQTFRDTIALPPGRRRLHLSTT